MEYYQSAAVGLVLGYILDLIVGDPAWLPHPIVLFGKLIARTEKIAHRGKALMLKGAVAALVLIGGVFALFYGVMMVAKPLPAWVTIAVVAVFVFYGLANKTLISEVRNVFIEVDKDISLGRAAVGRIVGRDTANLSREHVQKAALETLSENLSDGVVAPLFYFALLGVPGIMTYKMINTLDSMWGYKNERFLYFGRLAARMDDVANFIPSRLTALLMATVGGTLRTFSYIVRFGRNHTSPNSGYPEAALAGILCCRFGGGSYYGGVFFPKPAIGIAERSFTVKDMYRAVGVNHRVTLLMVLLIATTYTFVL